MLSFSVIMLNTDAHNPGVKNKMTRDGFLRNNRGIDDGQDLDGEMLGRAMQVDPMKPTLKAPGPKHLKLNCDILLSSFAFKFYLRRYSWGCFTTASPRTRSA